jgi:formylmethanofuran dehydrogenase subunit E
VSKTVTIYQDEAGRIYMVRDDETGNAIDFTTADSVNLVACDSCGEQYDLSEEWTAEDPFLCASCQAGVEA